jgi:hypothetical protein
MANVIERFYCYEISTDNLCKEIKSALKVWEEKECQESAHEFLGLCVPEFILFQISPGAFVLHMLEQREAGSSGPSDD